MAVHHSGLAADVDALRAIGRERGIPVVEDCAQAYGVEYKGRLAGTFTEISSFSLNHFKHISCGSGGMILTDDDRLRYVASLFVDKCYQREEKIRNPFFLAPNYQMTELQGAVALAQLERVEAIVKPPQPCSARALSALVSRHPGNRLQTVPAGSKHSYFLYLFRLDLELLGCTSREFSQALAAEGIPNEAHMITGGRPVYLYDIFQKRSAFPGSEYPFSLTGQGVPAGRLPRGRSGLRALDHDEFVRALVGDGYRRNCRGHSAKWRNISPCARQAERVVRA